MLLMALANLSVQRPLCLCPCFVIFVDAHRQNIEERMATGTRQSSSSFGF
jgi:hypothetical protein